MSDRTADLLLTDLGSEMRRIALEPGERLVREGEQASEVFVVLRGELVALSSSDGREAEVGRVAAGDIVGEVTAVAGGQRTATLEAATPTEVAVIGRGEFEAWLSARPDLGDQVSLQARDRIDRIQLVRMFDRFLDVTDDELMSDLLAQVEWVRVEAGELLFRQGDVSDAAYFVVSGRIVVTISDDDGHERRVRELARGEVVGELGLLDRAPRSATVHSVRDTTLARFDAASFERLITRHPQLMLGVARSLLGRLNDGRRSGRPDRATSVAVAITAPDAPDGLVHDICAEVSSFGSVQLLSSSGVDRYLGRPGIAQVAIDNADVPRLAEFLHEAEVGNDHVVFVADPEPTPWTRRILRQADRIVVVVSAAPDADELRRIRGVMALLPDRVSLHRMLAVCQPAGADRPRGTRALRTTVGADEVVHLRPGNVDDVGRLARLASGHGVGLVLSGGGARGFAHLGVVRALMDVGVPIDAIGACSIGAPLGAGIAAGHVGDAMIEVAERQFHRLLDYTLPVVALLKGERISRSITGTFDGWDFDDLLVPFYCVSTNLTDSRLIVHRDGDLSRAFRASVAIPGVLPPVPLDGELLVDGGVLNNLPIEPMLDDPRIGTVVAVDVAPPTGPRARTDYGLSVSGGRALLAALRRKRTYPSASAVLMRSMLVGAVRNQQQSLQRSDVDLLLRLSLPGISLLQFDAVRPVAAAGFDSSIDAVRQWAATAGWPRPPR